MGQRLNVASMLRCRVIVEPYVIKVSNSGEQMTFISDGRSGRCCSLVVDLPGVQHAFQCPYSGGADHGYTYCLKLKETLFSLLQSLGLVHSPSDHLLLCLISFVLDFLVNRHACPLDGPRPRPVPVAYISVGALQEADLARAPPRSVSGTRGKIWMKRATRESVEGLHAVTELDADAPNSCVICLQELVKHDRREKIVRMPCTHVFHGDCIAGWLQKSNVCPLCRFEMPAELIRISASSPHPQLPL